MQPGRRLDREREMFAITLSHTRLSLYKDPMVGLKEKQKIFKIRQMTMKKKTVASTHLYFATVVCERIGGNFDCR